MQIKYFTFKSFSQTPTTELMSAIQLGIKYSISLLAKKPERDILMSDFTHIDILDFPQYRFSSCFFPFLFFILILVYFIQGFTNILFYRIMRLIFLATVFTCSFTLSPNGNYSAFLKSPRNFLISLFASKRTLFNLRTSFP